MTLIESRRKLKQAEAAYREAARARAEGIPNEVRYEGSLASLLAAYESVTLSNAHV